MKSKPKSVLQAKPPGHQTANRQTKDRSELHQTSLDRALGSGLRATPPSVERPGFVVVLGLDAARTLVGRVTAFPGALHTLVVAALTHAEGARREGLQFDQLPAPEASGSVDEEVRA